MHVLISPNPYRDRQFTAAMRVRDKLSELGVDSSFCLPFGTEQDVTTDCGIEFKPMEEVLPRCDVYICLGGDGTILHASKVAAEHDIPILGINLGTLGFMSELDLNSLDLLKKLTDGTYKVESRLRLQVSVNSHGKLTYTEHALNDAVITKGAVARVLQLTVSCNGRPMTSFSGDGVIVSTSTGSTAYSLSAGGPVVEPSAEVFLVTPICAHGFSAHCIVTDASRRISVTSEKATHRSAFLSVDGGRAVRMEYGDTVNISRSDKVSKFIRLKEDDFFGTIHHKFTNR
ncbi:MAG: NAD(+)/NADH kinase [Oscillospiraceae bacterium]|nr:NAD(+)/NADH kinase [Oscillospiraceae bacterium]